MKKYIWLNPIVVNAYNTEDLKEELFKLGYIIVSHNINHLKIVLDKYRNFLSDNSTLLDQRCPMITEYFKKNNFTVIYHNIEPILIHAARELENRSDLKDGQKWIVTPCLSLKSFGDNLNLKNTYFITWDEFVNVHKLKIPFKPLKNSPIPMGFFDSIAENVLKITDNNISDLTQEKLNKYKLVEGLFCRNGCHNGDGVKCIQSK
ncbi:hypothetical protein [Treponema pedis]|uniref:hypothetical protein n=1 Tax=Treponema pedis TaxID=409322 RepID=UPI000418CB3D|nr:hypothetical protein [Treponema pedis]QSI03627.1 hypothetical protein DYQ05_01195 [Treponema pedis]